MASATKVTKPIVSRKQFHTPIIIAGGDASPTAASADERPLSVDEQISKRLEQRKKVILDREAVSALELAHEENQRDSARVRAEAKHIEETGKNPEEDSMRNPERIAEVAAEVVKAGGSTEEAKDLATGKKPLAIIQSKAGEAATATQEGKGGWLVLNGKPVRDLEGEYTFSQALKVCELERPKDSSSSPIAILDWAEKKGILGPGKNDEFMSKFLAELATKSIDSIVKPAANPGRTDDTDLRAEMKELREQIRLASDPVESAKRVKEMYTTFQSLGIVQTASGGESLDALKVKYGHEEKMAEIDIDRDYKESIATTLGDTVERVGRGIAHQWRAESGAGPTEGGSEGGMDYFTCPEKGCGSQILIPPDSTTLICPKCGSVYQRKKKV